MVRWPPRPGPDWALRSTPRRWQSFGPFRPNARRRIEDARPSTHATKNDRARLSRLAFPPFAAEHGVQKSAETGAHCAYDARPHDVFNVDLSAIGRDRLGRRRNDVVANHAGDQERHCEERLRMGLLP